MGTKCRIFHSIWGKVRERERERRSWKKIARRGRGEWERRWKGGEFRLFRKLIIRPSILSSNIFNFSLFLSLTSRELEWRVSFFFCRDTLLYLIAREEEGDTKTSPVWRRVPRKRYPCILRALYLINRTNEFPFPSLRSTKRPSFSTTFGFENIGRCRVL